MPWVKIGRYRFALDDVALVADMVGAEHKEGDVPQSGVTVSLKTGLSFDFLGADADVFTRTFDRHVAGRAIGRPPPRVRGGRVSYPPANRELLPVEAHGAE